MLRKLSTKKTSMEKLSMLLSMKHLQTNATPCKKVSATRILSHRNHSLTRVDRVQEKATFRSR